MVGSNTTSTLPWQLLVGSLLPSPNQSSCVSGQMYCGTVNYWHWCG